MQHDALQAQDDDDNMTRYMHGVSTFLFFFFSFPCPFLIYQFALARRLESAIKYDILEQSIRMGLDPFLFRLFFFFT